MSQKDYDDGWADGMAGKAPAFERLALGANRLNDYERGYIDSGKAERDPRAALVAAKGNDEEGLG